MSNEQNYPEYHPLIDGRRAGFGDEEVYTCDDCGHPFLAEEASWSRYNGEPICMHCKEIQDSEVK